MRLAAFAVATVAALGLLIPALAQDAPPDVTGTWTGTFTGGVRGGGGDLSPADDPPRFVRPGDRIYTLTISEQDGRGFAGTWASDLGSEALQGVIRLDDATLLMVDEDSTLTATLLSESEMELCNHTLSAGDRFSMCFLLRRE